MSCKEALALLDEPLQTCKKAPESEQRLMIGEICVAETRKAFLEAVSASDKSKLKDCHCKQACRSNLPGCLIQAFNEEAARPF